MTKSFTSSQNKKMNTNLTPEECIAGLYVISIFADGQLQESESGRALDLFMKSSKLSGESAVAIFSNAVKAVKTTSNPMGLVNEMCHKIMSHYDRETLTVICAHLIAISTADGEMHRNEAAHIAIVLQIFGIDLEDLR